MLTRMASTKMSLAYQQAECTDTAACTYELQGAQKKRD